jgi:pyruvate/2-oxoglutarate dehydrogenase complex dihydrolipoamide dehydrogenase (E3) component
MEDVEFWQPHENTIRLTNSQTLHYVRLCIATGAVPKTLAPQPMNTVIQIRDVDTIERLQARLADARRIVIVGTGGIAMELAYELKNMEIYWASKSAYVGTPFFDATIGLALEERFNKGREEGELKREVVLNKYAVEPNRELSAKSTLGCSLGPNWLAKLEQPIKQEQVSLSDLLIVPLLINKHLRNEL